MTTYRIRPLVWTQNPSEGRHHYAYPLSGYRYTVSMRPVSGLYGWEYFAANGPTVYPPDIYATVDEARAACESHWRGVLSAALEPVPDQP